MSLEVLEAQVWRFSSYRESDGERSQRRLDITGTDPLKNMREEAHSAPERGQRALPPSQEWCEPVQRHRGRHGSNELEPLGCVA